METTTTTYSPYTGRDAINVYVINTTSSTFTLNDDTKSHHGKTVNNPATSIAANSASTLIASFGSDDTYGPLGLFSYSDYPGGTTLTIYYNNPEENEITTATAEINQWFYAMLQPPQGSDTTYYVDISGFTMSVYGNGDDNGAMNPVITISQEPLV